MIFATVNICVIGKASVEDTQIENFVVRRLHFHSQNR